MTVAIIGGGLAGSLLALELRTLGVEVLLVAPALAEYPAATATSLSYGAVAAWAAPLTPLGRLMRQSPRRWELLQRRHGDLGWRRRSLRLHGVRGVGSLLQAVPLPCSQVEAGVFAAALPGVLERAGVRWRQARVEQLEQLERVQPNGPNGGERWRLQLPGGDSLQAQAVVLAAGSHSRELWPALGPSLWVSWAGVIELERWPVAYRCGQLVLPGPIERLALERRAAAIEQEQWVVDPGLVPRGEGALMGQISLVRPGRQAGEPPDAALMEQRLREALDRFDPALVRAAGTYRQVPVAFCTDGQPLVGPVPGALGLWQFTGFSAAFGLVPVLTPRMAAALAASLRTPASPETGGGWGAPPP